MNVVIIFSFEATLSIEISGRPSVSVSLRPNVRLLIHLLETEWRKRAAIKRHKCKNIL